MDAPAVIDPTALAGNPYPTRQHALCGQPNLAPADRALLDLGRELKHRSYSFITITPASHSQINARHQHGRTTLADVFGWSRPFAPSDIPDNVLTLLADAGELRSSGALFRSGVRFSTLGDQLFVHSAFPTQDPDAVFFGPDTYRFARTVRHSLKELGGRRRALRIVDVGAGSGAGGLHAAALIEHCSPTLVLTDINARALRFCRINAALNDVAGVQTIASDLFAAVEGPFDLIISNPPYLVDPLARLYRHGGGELGFELSLNIVEQGLHHLARGGRLVLYTGSAIVGGRDLFHDILASRLAARDVRFGYEEIDPDVFGEELAQAPYDRADRIAAVGVVIDVP